MANLRWFRRHQKVMMVVFGVGLMAVFGLGGVVSMISPSDLTSGSADDKTIAIWDGGEIKRSHLDNMRVYHYRTVEFLNALQAEARAQLPENEFRSPAMMITPIIRPGEDFQQELVDEELIRRYLLAKKAEKDGLVVSEKMLDEYLAIVAGNARFSRNDHKALNAQVNQNRVSMTSIREHLKIELAAQQMDLFSFAGFPFYPNPNEALELNSKMTREVDCQVYPIPTENFLKDTGEPSEAEIKNLYQNGKYNYPDPRGIKPGFKNGKKVSIEYFVADFETFLQNEMSKLSTEEIQKYYEKMVEDENSLVMEIIPEEPTDETDLTETPKPKSTDEAPKPRDKQEKPPAASDDNGPPVPKTGTDDDQSSKEKDSSNDDQKKDDGDGLSLVVSAQPEHFVALQDDQDDKKEETTEQKTDESTENKQDDSSEKKSDEAKSQQTDPAKSDADKPDEPKQDATVDEKSTDQDPDMIQIPEIKDEPTVKRRPKPLKDVLDQVKREMVRKDATDAVQRAVAIAEGEVRTYTSLYGSWESTLESERGDKPVPPDMKKIADDNGLQYVNVGQVDELQFSEDTLGKVIMFIPQRNPPTTTVAQTVFDRFENLNLFDPIPTNDIMSGANYLYWLTDKKDAEVPSLDDARPAIVKFWKRQKSVELAMAEANKIAEQINSSDDRTLVQLYPVKSIPTGAFRWFTTSFNGAPRLSSPAGVTGAWDEFMSTAFSLEPKQAGIAPNFNRDIVYIVQLISDNSVATDIGTEFLEDKFFKFREMPNDIQAISQFHNRDLREDWRDEFEKSLGLEFVGH